jgi:hypothetical protein
MLIPLGDGGRPILVLNTVLDIQHYHIELTTPLPVNRTKVEMVYYTDFVHHVYSDMSLVILLM